MAENARGAVLRRAVETCISPDDDTIAMLGELFTDDVTVWSPNVLAVGLAELSEILASAKVAFSDVDIEFDSLDIFGNQGLAEFRVAATFSGSFVVDDDGGDRAEREAAPARHRRCRRLRRRQDQGVRAPTSTTPACWSRCSTT